MFTIYGSLEDQGSVISKSPYILIRHGISRYNTFSAAYRQKLQQEYPGNSDEILETRKNAELAEFGDWRKNHNLVDALLEEPAGHQQSLDQ